MQPIMPAGGRLNIENHLITVQYCIDRPPATAQEVTDRIAHLAQAHRLRNGVVGAS